MHLSVERHQRSFRTEIFPLGSRSVFGPSLTPADVPLMSALRKVHCLIVRCRARDPYDHAVSGDEQNFSEVLVGTHAGERARDLVERVRTIDRDAQTACRDRVPQVGSHLARDLAHLLD